MKTNAPYPIFLFIAILLFNGYSETGIIVQRGLYYKPGPGGDTLRNKLNLFISTLQSVDHRNVIMNQDYYDSLTNPAQIRAGIYNEYIAKRNTPDSLDGVILIGNLRCALWPEITYNDKKMEYDTTLVPFDLFYMNLNAPDPEQLWDRFAIPADTDGTPIYSDSRGPGFCNIWVSRIMAPTFHKLPNTSYPPELNWSPDTLIADYLQRAINRMTQEPTVPSRALVMGDFYNGFDTLAEGIRSFPSAYPITLIKYPASSPHVWMRELRKGYEYVSFIEHSCPTGSRFGQDHGCVGPNAQYTGWFWSYAWPPEQLTPDFPPGQFVTMGGNYPPPCGGGISKCLFFTLHGCSQMNWKKDLCLGQMYGMMQSGLISMGAETEDYPWISRDSYVQSLFAGSSFGTAYLKLVNENCGPIYTLFGAGTLKLQPYVPNPKQKTIIDSISYALMDINKTPVNPGDTLQVLVNTKRDYIADSDVRWYGNWHNTVDSTFGFYSKVVIEDQQLGQYPQQYTVHIDPQNKQSASAVLQIPGLTYQLQYRGGFPNSMGKQFALLGRDSVDSIHIVHAKRPCPSWTATLVGLNGAWNARKDNYVYYSMPFKNNDFEVSASVDSLLGKTLSNQDTILAPGVMIRATSGGFSGGEPSAFLGAIIVRDNNRTEWYRPVFLYREKKDDPVTIHSGPNLLAGYSFYIEAEFKLTRRDSKIFAQVTDNNYGVSIMYEDSMTMLSDGEYTAGLAYLNTEITDATQSYGARFWNYKARYIPSLPNHRNPLQLYLQAVVACSTYTYNYNRVHIYKGVYWCFNSNSDTVVIPNKPDSSNDRYYTFAPGWNYCPMTFSSDSMSWRLDNSTASAYARDTCSFQVVAQYQGMTFYLDPTLPCFVNSADPLKIGLYVRGGKFTGMPIELWFKINNYCYTPYGWYPIPEGSNGLPAYDGPLPSLSSPYYIWEGYLSEGYYILSFGVDAVQDNVYNPFFESNIGLHVSQ